jgi:hypothetical protein
MFIDRAPQNATPFEGADDNWRLITRDPSAPSSGEGSRIYSQLYKHFTPTE